MGIFYKSERKAFMPHIVRKSFAEVGLWPWNPDLILENCLKHCPVDSQQVADEMMRDLIDAINIHKQKQEAWCNKILSDLEEANITDDKNYDDDDDEDVPSSSSDTEHMPLEPQPKRMRKSSIDRKTCSARGCQKSHFWSKKWVMCPKCKKNFCPKHAEKLHHHKC